MIFSRINNSLLRTDPVKFLVFNIEHPFYYFKG